MIRAIHHSNGFAFKQVGTRGAIHRDERQSSKDVLCFHAVCPCGCDRIETFRVHVTKWNKSLQSPTIGHIFEFDCGNRFTLTLGYWEFAQ